MFLFVGRFVLEFNHSVAQGALSSQLQFLNQQHRRHSSPRRLAREKKVTAIIIKQQSTLSRD